jgi:adenylate kinase
MHLLIMGPPGAGKGTQAGRIGAHYQIPAISTGDMFRAMRALDTPLARQVQEIMASGEYVPDDLTNQVVAERLLADDCAKGFLLDGYPRTLQQVDYLDGVLDEGARALNAVISLQADSDEVVRRLLKRAETSGRDDDNEATIRTRQDEYTEETAPLLDVYRDRGLLVEVDGLGAVDDVSQRLFAALDARAGSGSALVGGASS